MLLLIFLLFSGIFTSSQAFIGIWLARYHQFSIGEISVYWFFFAIISSITQFNIIKIPLTKNYILFGFCLYSSAMFGFIIFENLLGGIFLSSIILAIAIGILNTALVANLSVQGKKNSQGMLLGINQAIGSFGRMLGPGIISPLYYINHNFAWIFILFVCIIALYQVNKFKIKKVS